MKLTTLPRCSAHVSTIIGGVRTNTRPDGRSVSLFDVARVIRTDFGHNDNFLALDACECINAWLRTHAFSSHGTQEAVTAFLPWCLMRAVEMAHESGLTTVAVACDEETWDHLSGTRLLARQVYGDIHILRSVPARHAIN